MVKERSLSRSDARPTAPVLQSRGVADSPQALVPRRVESADRGAKVAAYEVDPSDRLDLAVPLGQPANGDRGAVVRSEFHRSFHDRAVGGKRITAD
jgi:hypothetical protein